MGLGGNWRSLTDQSLALACLVRMGLLLGLILRLGLLVVPWGEGSSLKAGVVDLICLFNGGLILVPPSLLRPCLELGSMGWDLVEE